MQTYAMYATGCSYHAPDRHRQCYNTEEQGGKVELDKQRILTQVDTGVGRNGIHLLPLRILQAITKQTVTITCYTTR